MSNNRETEDRLMLGLGIALLAGVALGWAARAANPPKVVKMKEPEKLPVDFGSFRVQQDVGSRRLSLGLVQAGSIEKPKRRRRKGDDDPFAFTAPEVG